MVIAGGASFVGKVGVAAGGAGFIFKTVAFLAGSYMLKKTVDKILKIADYLLVFGFSGTVYWVASERIKENCIASPNHPVCPFPPYIDLILIFSSIGIAGIATAKLISEIFVKEKSCCTAYGDYCSSYGARCSTYWTRFSTFCVNLLPCKGNGSK